MFSVLYGHLVMKTIFIFKTLVFVHGHGQCTRIIHFEQESNRYYKSFMQLDTIGVSQCIKMCKRYKLCKKIHHNREQLTCDLVMTFGEKGNLLSLLDIDSAKGEDPNSDLRSETEVCVDRDNASPVCIHKDMCLDGWIPFHNKCYFFGEEQKTADETTEICRNMNAKLVRIDNEDLFLFLTSEMGKRGLELIWTAANDRAVENQWVWGSGDEVPNEWWGNGEPNNIDNEDCGVLRLIDNKGVLMDFNCETKLPRFACEDSIKPYY